MPLGFGAIGQGSGDIPIADLAARAICRATATASFSRGLYLQAAATCRASARASFAAPRRGVFVFDVPPDSRSFTVPPDR